MSRDINGKYGEMERVEGDFSSSQSVLFDPFPSLCLFFSFLVLITLCFICPQWPRIGLIDLVIIIIFAIDCHPASCGVR